MGEGKAGKEVEVGGARQRGEDLEDLLEDGGTRLQVDGDGGGAGEVGGGAFARGGGGLLLEGARDGEDVGFGAEGAVDGHGEPGGLAGERGGAGCGRAGGCGGSLLKDEKRI